MLRAAIRFLPVALCAMTMAILAVGVVGMLMGYGFMDAIMYVAIPMMGGGMGAGVVPLSGMYAEALHVDAAGIISRMIPASTLGNVTAIVAAGMLAKLGEVKPSLSGNGKLMKKEMEYAAQQWSQFMMGNWTQALLVGIGISMIDLNAVISAFSVTYLILVLVVVGGVALGAGIGGYFVGFYPIESSITAGLCTTNMGGTGDIAVLSAAKRMELLPFAQISTRICGALVLVVASILIKILF